MNRLAALALALWTGLGLWLSPTASAQQTKTDSLQREIETLQQRIDSLETAARRLQDPTAADTLPQGRSRLVTRISGAGSMRTQSFSVSGTWRVRWESAARIFFLSAFEAGAARSTSPAVLAGPGDPTAGAATFDRGGRYYLVVQSTGPWSVTILRAD